MMEMKIQMFNPGDRVVRNKTKDQALYIVVSGLFFGLEENYPSKKDMMFSTGAVIGCKQFIKNDYWDMDIIC